MTDTRAIDRLFDALASRDIDQTRAALSPHAQVWHSFDRIAHDREAILASFAELFATFTDIRFYDVRCQPIATGFVRQHVMAVKADGHCMAWPVCVVVQAEDDMIVRVDEYIDRAGSFTPHESDLLTPGF